MAEPQSRRLAAVMFCDMVGFTAAMQEDEQSALASRDRYRTVIEHLHDEFGGQIVQYYGDGTLSIFGNSVDAVRCGVAIQQTLSEAPVVPARVGMHVGDVVVEEHGLLGDAVNVASRIESFGQPGAVLMSESVQDLVKNQPDLELVSLGEFHLDNVARPHELLAVDTDGLVVPDAGSLNGKGRPVGAAVLSNLPVQVTSFVGRVQESAELEKLVRGSRLVTVTGAGGCGKSRLTVEVAAELLDEYSDGVWLVELAPMSDSRLVASTVANVLGVREQPGTDTLEVVTGFLGHKDLLLVVDNCEHLIEPVAELVAHLLTHTTGIRIAATSREPLHVRGEAIYHLPTLPVPDPDDDWETLTHVDSVRLFAERAEAAHPGFRVTHDNGAAVASICRHLDGIPLAVELAAAATRMFTPDQIDQRLADRFSLLKGGARDDVDHHRSLEATIDWSYQLLSPEQQVLLARLAVFVGSFTHEAAEDVCTDESMTVSEVNDAVVHLADSSLLEIDDSELGMRYRLLETILTFAMDRLLDRGEKEMFERAHAEYFRRLAVDSYDHLWGPDEVEWLDRLEEDWPNLRRSLQWQFEEGHVEDGQMMAGSLRSFFWRRGHYLEGLEWLGRFVHADTSASPARARALTGLATLQEADRSLWDEAISLIRRFGSPSELAGALNNASITDQNYGDWGTAEERLSEALLLAEEVGQSGLLYMVHGSYIDVAMATNNPERALASAESALHWARQQGSPENTFYAAAALGLTRRYTGDLAGAEQALLEAHDVQVTLSDSYLSPGWLEALQASLALDRNEIETAIGHLIDYAHAIAPFRADTYQWDREFKPLLQCARVASALGEYETAATVLGALEAFHSEPGSAMSHFPPYLDEVSTAIDEVKPHLEPERFDVAWSRGLNMTSDEAIDYALILLDDA